MPRATSRLERSTKWRPPRRRRGGLFVCRSPAEGIQCRL